MTILPLSLSLSSDFLNNSENRLSKKDRGRHPQMDAINPKPSLGNFAIMFMFIVGALYLSFWSSSTDASYSCLTQQYQRSLPNETAMDVPKDDLEAALIRASMADRTVIITVINKAYADQDVNSDSTMLDVFLDSFWVGENTRYLLDHLLIVAVDQTAYDRCKFLRLNCYRLETEGVDLRGEKIYMSPDFIKMMWRRTRFLSEVLKRGYNFIFTDTDVVWLRNPFEKLSKNETEDIQMSTDMFFGDPWSSEQLINTGFYFVRSNNKTIALFDKWYSLKDNSAGMKEQDVLLNLIRNASIIPKLGLRMRFLDTLYFSGFCQDSKDFGLVTTVHANCCRSIEAKVGDLRVVLRDWKKFKASSYQHNAANSTPPTTSFVWSGHFGCWNSWNPKKDTKV